MQKGVSPSRKARRRSRGEEDVPRLCEPLLGRGWLEHTDLKGTVLHAKRGLQHWSPHPSPGPSASAPTSWVIGAGSKFPRPKPPDLVPCPSPALVSQGGYKVTTDRTSLHLGQGLACTVNPQPRVAVGL